MKSGVVIHYSNPECRLVLRWDNDSYSIVEEHFGLHPEINWVGVNVGVSVAKRDMEKIAKIVLELKEEK